MATVSWLSLNMGRRFPLVVGQVMASVILPPSRALQAPGVLLGNFR